ncbi:MAB_1171c family putative transporter [Streptomyces filamentosus]|uniref:DUF6545 domain-containing protein n=1 Tax=Streptomyces filamentosus TaxID=67294 RepID=A0A919BPR0_STRFL|nr:MAB_1171c family putative transporter [Streptomyces filamentosus]GHG05207.1 hypothetical protein GCM10017667_39990 [Streptomyces filamentosus]
MSETTTNFIYFLVALINLLIACWKGLALVRERSVTLALITLSFFISVLVYITASPAGYRRLGEITGRPSAATLPVYIGIVVCYGITHVLTTLWTVTTTPEERARVNRRATTWAGVYGLVITAMTVTFCAADLAGYPADPVRFNTDFAEGQPFVQIFLVLFLVTLSCATLSTGRLARRTRPREPHLRHAVRCFSLSMVVCFGYVLCNAPAVLLASFGNHALDDIGVLGSLFGTVAACITSYGMCGAAISAWLRERRDIKTLQPLWQLCVMEVDGRLALHPRGSGLRLANVRFTLHRRVIEILDGMRVLRIWTSAEATEAIRAYVEAEADQLFPMEREAIVTAAVLRDAAERLTETRRQAESTGQIRPIPPQNPTGPLPGHGTAASEERGRLLLVAACLRHPLVASALREVREPDQGLYRSQARQRAR